MAKIYCRQIRDNIMTIDEVPVLWRNKVKELLGL